MNIANQILDDLRFLYGPEQADKVSARLSGILKRHVEQAPTPASPMNRDRLPLDQKDALLITYGDQIQKPGEAPLKTLATFLRTRVLDVINGVHLLPFYPYSSDDGFSVIDYQAVNSELGSWDDIRNLSIDFKLMFDAVFNHISARSAWFQSFLRGEAPYREFFTVVTGNPDLSQVVRPRALPLLTEFDTVAGQQRVWTTFSADQIDLEARNPEVVLKLIEVLLYYVSQGARFIRLDAIAFLWKEIGTPCLHRPQTHRIIQLFRHVLNNVAPNTILITETNVPHADNISYFGDGTNEAQLIYNFALPPLVLHSLLTGNGRKLTHWAKSLATPSDQVTFFNFLASHDGIGLNPVRGILDEGELNNLVETVWAHQGYVSDKTNPDGTRSPYELNINYFDALSDPNDNQESVATQVNRFLVAHAIMLALAGMPGIYFHSLFGSRNDRAGAESSGIPRRINRQKLLRSDVETELSTPNSLRAQVFQGFRRLLQVRRAQTAFHPVAPQEIFSFDDRVFILLRTALNSNQRVLCLHNLSRETVALNGLDRDLTLGRDLLRTEPNDKPPDTSGIMVLSPYQAAWIATENQG